MQFDAAPAHSCELCRKPARHRVHEGCQRHLDEALTALPHLYRELGAALMPSRRGNEGRTATRSAPIPPNEDALNLRGPGGMASVTADWEDDIRRLLGWEQRPFRGSIEQTLHGCVVFLRGNLHWICDEHPDVRGLAHDINKLIGQATALVTGERQPRRVPVACPCGQTLRITLNTDGERCPTCQTQYGHAELFDLPLAARSAA